MVFVDRNAPAQGEGLRSKLRSSCGGDEACRDSNHGVEQGGVAAKTRSLRIDGIPDGSAANSLIGENPDGGRPVYHGLVFAGRQKDTKRKEQKPKRTLIHVTP